MGGVALYDFEYDFTVENGGAANWKRPESPPALLRLALGEDVLAEIVYIQLNSADISDQELGTLQGVKALSGLQHLCLTGTMVTDESIPYLIQLSQLRFLDIRNTRISEAGAAELRNTLPNCRIAK